MGVVTADLDDDGLVDLFQVNDSSPNFLFRNLGDGRFRDVALDAGVAYDASGRRRERWPRTLRTSTATGASTSLSRTSTSRARSSSATTDS